MLTSAPRRELVSSVAELVGSVREARWIVEAVEGDDDPRGAALALAGRRRAGEPLQYVLGRWPFRRLELHVDRRVLIPRPETEQVVEVALAELARSVAARRGPAAPAATAPAATAPGPFCADLGTGSGAIALSLVAEAGPSHPDLRVWATDVSADALAVARANAAARWPGPDGEHAAPGLRLAAGSWFDALPPELAGRFDLVVSNPPYVAEAELAGLDAEVREWEPTGALVAGDGADGVGGMAAVEAVVGGAAGWLGPTGALVVEIAPHQGAAAATAARRAGFGDVRTERDLAGRTRMLVARRR